MPNLSVMEDGRLAVMLPLMKVKRLPNCSIFYGTLRDQQVPFEKLVDHPRFLEIVTGRLVVWPNDLAYVFGELRNLEKAAAIWYAIRDRETPYLVDQEKLSSLLWALTEGSYVRDRAALIESLFRTKLKRNSRTALSASIVEFLQSRTVTRKDIMRWNLEVISTERLLSAFHSKNSLPFQFTRSLTNYQYNYQEVRIGDDRVTFLTAGTQNSLLPGLVVEGCTIEIGNEKIQADSRHIIGLLKTGSWVLWNGKYARRLRKRDLKELRILRESGKLCVNTPTTMMIQVQKAGYDVAALPFGTASRSFFKPKKWTRDPARLQVKPPRHKEHALLVVTTSAPSAPIWTYNTKADAVNTDRELEMYFGIPRTRGLYSQPADSVKMVVEEKLEALMDEITSKILEDIRPSLHPMMVTEIPRISQTYIATLKRPVAEKVVYALENETVVSMTIYNVQQTILKLYPKARAKDAAVLVSTIATGIGDKLFKINLRSEKPIVPMADRRASNSVILFTTRTLLNQRLLAIKGS